MLKFDTHGYKINRDFLQITETCHVSFYCRQRSADGWYLESRSKKVFGCLQNDTTVLVSGFQLVEHSVLKP